VSSPVCILMTARIASNGLTVFAMRFPLVKML